MSEAQSRPRIVVGVDGSQHSIQALRWAARHARQFDAEIHAVTGWEVPWTIFVAPTYTEADYTRDARELQEKAVTEALGTEPDVPVEKHLVQQHPALALIRAAEGAELLVIGSHGHGRDKLPGILPGLHLGSVANYCAHHAPCPLVIIRS